MKILMILGNERKPNKDQSNIKYKQNKIKTIKTKHNQKFKNKQVKKPRDNIWLRLGMACSL